MTSTRRGIGGVQAAGAAAHDEHLFRMRRGLQLAQTFGLAADERVAGAAAGEGRGPLRHAGEAADAVDDLVVAIGHNFVRELVVGEKLPRHLHDVRLAGGDDLLHHGGIGQAADGGHGFFDVLFDLRGEVDVPAVLLEPRGVRDAEGALICTGRDVDDVDEIFKSLGDLNALVQVIAALDELVPAHAQLDGEPGSDGVSHGGQHLAGEADAVFKRTAVLVRAMVEQRGEELVDEPAVAGVDHEHLEARTLGVGGGGAVSGHDLVYHGLIQLFYLHTVRADMSGGTPLGKGGFLILVGEIGAGVLPGVRQLQGGNGPVALDGVGGVGEAGKALGDGQVQPEGVAAVRGMDHALRDRDRRRAAVGAQLVKLQRTRPDAAVLRDVRAAHGRGEHAVAEDGLADGDRRAEMGIFLFHASPSRCR